MSLVYSLLLVIDGLIYDVIDWMFDIFEFLTKANLFDTDVYNDIVKRVYVVLGLIMMFALSYSLLKAVINPDEFSKGENSFPKLIKNVVVSLVIIAVLPTVFTVAFNIQNSIINQDTIPKLVLGDDYSEGSYDDVGRSIAYNSFTAFFHVNEEWCKTNNKSSTVTETQTETENESETENGNDVDFKENLSSMALEKCGESIKTNSSDVKWYKPWTWLNGLKSDDDATFSSISSVIESGDLSIANFNQFSESVAEGKISYVMILSTLFGLFLLYVILNFCFDMAIRVIKLMFFQIIAPIPVVCRVIPGGKMKDVFSTWTKKTISTFIDVFIRIFIMYLGIFLIDTIIDQWSGLPSANLSTTQMLIAKALVIMGVVVFIRQAPKLLSDMFHLDTGDMKLGIMDKLAMGGAFVAGNAVGSLITSRGNPLAAWRGLQYGAKNKNFRNVGQENNYRLAKKEALQNGATRTGIIMDKMRRNFGFDTSFERAVRNDDYEISNIKDGMLAGNQAFIKVKDNIENRAKKKLGEDKSSYLSSIKYYTQEVYDTGMKNANGESIMGTRDVEHTETGNLDALRKFLQSNARNMTAEQITDINKQIANNESALVTQYIKDNVLQTEGTSGAKDAVMTSFINDMRDNGLLDGVLVDENGVSKLSSDTRNRILNPSDGDLWKEIEELGNEVSDAVNEQNRRILALNTQKQKNIVKYRAQSDIAIKPPNELKPHGDGGRSPRGGRPGSGPGGRSGGPF